MIRFAALLSMLALLAAQATAAPDRSPRAKPRPVADEAPPAIFLVRVGYHPTVRPRPRPARVSAQLPLRVVQVASAGGVFQSPRPASRPDKLRRRGVVAASGMRSQPSGIMLGRKGALCGNRAIRGETLAPIPGRLKGCGVDRPVRVTSVDGVALSQPAIMDCATASALNRWVQQGVKPAIGRLGGGVGSLRVAAHYSCRTRNNKPGGKISEHGRGKAIDVAAITLKNGAEVSVLKGWRDPAQGRLLRRMHQSACGPFGTVLGPHSDRFHQDHFHLDTAAYRSGAYCR